MTNQQINPDDGGPWGVGMERVPLVRFETNEVHIQNFRNFRFECDGSHEENYESRSIKIDELETADFIVVPFASQPDLAHTIFGAFPLMYAIADERDAIGQRTELRGDDVYLYRVRANPEQVQAFFRCVMRRVDKLSKSPEKYNTVTNNCLTNIRYHMNQVWPGLIPWNWRILINAHSDYLAYKLCLLESQETFQATREQALVTPRAKGNWHRDDFSEIIRMTSAPITD